MKTPLATAALLLASTTALAQEKSPYEIFQKQALSLTDQWKTQYAGRDDVLIAPGVLADKTKKTVTIPACATGLGAGESVEFFVTPLNSGKDYEALTAAVAKPSDVIAALKFIGLTPGEPIDFQKNRQWPRGPRVIMTFDIAGKTLRAEDCIINTDSKATLPKDGLVFAGSYTYTDDTGKTHLAADESESKSIASDYNEPSTVLDVPRRAVQGVVYGFQKPSDAFLPKQGDPVTITLTPATGDAVAIEHNILITAAPHEGGIHYDITENGKPLGSADDLPHLLTTLAGLQDGKSDWFTTTKIDPALRVEDVRKLYAVLQAVEKDRGIKLDPPLPGDLFYRAFFPDPAWRDRENRLGEPWELFLARKDGATAARLERLVEPDNGGPDAKRILQTYPAGTPEAFTKAINDHASQWSKAVFIYPPADMTYGELMKWVAPALPTYPQVFIFPETPATTQKSN